MTVAADTVAINIRYQLGAFVEGPIDNNEKVASAKKHTQFKIRVLKPYPIYNQNGQNRYPIYDPNITRVSLRQSCLKFNFPGKKIPALHHQQAGF